MIKAVIFDADGVLINGELFSKYVEKDYGISWEEMKYFFDQVLPDCVVGKKDLKEVLPEYLSQWGITMSVDQFLDYWHVSQKEIDQELITYVMDLRKKGIICALATNQTKYRFEYMLKEMGFATIFDKVYVSAHLGYQKPEHSFYLKVFEDLGISSKKEILFWDDSPSNVQGAKDFGILAEVYTTFFDFEQKMKQYLS